MARNDNDDFDKLITQSLRDNMGPPPSRELWGRILAEISEPVTPPPPPAPRRWEWLENWLRGPMVRMALIGTLVFAAVSPSAMAEYQRITSIRALPAPTIPLTLPVHRPLPAADVDQSAAVQAAPAQAHARAARIPFSQLTYVEGP